MAATDRPRLLCAFCGEYYAVRMNRIGVLLKPSCRICLWQYNLATRFDGRPMSEYHVHDTRKARNAR